MDTDSTDYEKQKEHRDSLLVDWDVPEPSGVCRISSRNNGNHWLGLLDYNAFVLCIGSCILCAFLLFA